MARNANRLTKEPEAPRGSAAGELRQPRARYLVGLLAMCLVFVAGAAGQSAPSLVVQPIPTGQRPMGVEIDSRFGFAAVANSGENSLSLLKIEQSAYLARFAVVTSSRLISGIPSPFGVIHCDENGTDAYVVTSPTTNSVSFVDLAKGSVTATVKVGSQPYSAACYYPNMFVSNYGDTSVSVVNLISGTVRTIPNIPGNRGLHGLVAVRGGGSSPVLWVAGTDANVVTVADSTSGAIIASIPVRAPTFVDSPNPDSSTPTVRVGSSLGNTIFGFDAPTLTVSFKITGVPTPQDFAATSDYGWLATTGPGSSVVSVAQYGPTATFASGIPGAAGIAAGRLIMSYPPYSATPFVLVTSPDSNRVFLIQQPPTGTPSVPSQFSVVGASFGGAQAAPGGLASAFATTGVVQSFLAQSLPLSRTLGGVSLRFGGSLTFDSANTRWNYSSEGSLDAPLLFVGPSQVNFQVPPAVGPGSAIPAQMTRPDGSTLLTTLTIAAAAPGIFTVLQNGIGQAAALNQDNTVNFGTNPARRGSVIQIFATGAGETTPPLAAGEAAPPSGSPLVLTKVQPTVTIGGKNAKVQFSGMAPGFVGLWQINAEVPADVTPGMALPLVITAAGASSNTVTIAVQ